MDHYTLLPFAALFVLIFGCGGAYLALTQAIRAEVKRRPLPHIVRRRK